MCKLFIITAVFVATNALACNVNSSELENVATTFRKQIVQKASAPTEVAIKKRIPYILVDDENTSNISSSRAFTDLLSTFDNENLNKIRRQFNTFQSNCLKIVDQTEDNKEKASVYLILKATYDAIVKTLRQQEFVRTIIDKAKQNRGLQSSSTRIASGLFDECDQL